MKTNKNVLIIGIDSLIGRNLSNFYTLKGWHVFGTSRKKNNNPNIIHFELGNDIENLSLKTFQTCVICAGVTSIEECEINPIKSREINVFYTLDIIKACMKLNLFTLFLSSDLVFRGERIFPKVKDEANPDTNSGIFKLEVENFINSLKTNNFSILRLTKVISEETPILKKWDKLLKKNYNIEAFDDVYISPVDINKVVETIFNITDNKFSGTYQLGGDMIISYYNFARLYFKNKEIDMKLIKPIKSNLIKIYNRFSSLKIHLP